MRILSASAVVALTFITSSARAGDFALCDGDTVVFLGDSITAARTYGKLIENYTLLRFPDRRVRFVNAGRGGDTAAGGLKRFETDVLVHNPTVVTVAYGVNDIGWGAKADDAHKRDYLAGIRGIVEACRKRKIRVYVCSAAATAEAPAKAEDGFLQKMCDEGMELSRTLGGNAIDVQRGMRAVQKRMAEANRKVADKAKHDSLHVADGVHLNDVGQLAMAFAILKGLGAPADVSSVTIDAADVGKITASGCTVRDAEAKDGGVRFTRLDDGLPFNYGIFYGLNYRFIPVPEELNRYQLKVTGLAAGKYDVTADDRAVGTFTAEQLAAGVNIASTTADPWQPGGPWNAQANALKELTDARHEIGQASRMTQLDLPKSGTAVELAKQADDLDARLVQAQRTVAKPRPYRFVVKPHAAGSHHREGKREQHERKAPKPRPTIGIGTARQGEGCLRWTNTPAFGNCAAAVSPSAKSLLSCGTRRRPSSRFSPVRSRTRSPRPRHGPPPSSDPSRPSSMTSWPRMNPPLASRGTRPNRSSAGWSPSTHSPAATPPSSGT